MQTYEAWSALCYGSESSEQGWLQWRKTAARTLCSPEVGSGGPRALQKVPKRALVRVDPLKKVLLRVSALLRVLKEVLKRVALLKRGLKKLLLGVNH